MRQEHSLSEDETSEKNLNDNEVLPLVSDDSDKEDNPNTETGLNTVDEEDVDVDDPNEIENHNRYSKYSKSI